MADAQQRDLDAEDQKEVKPSQQSDRPKKSFSDDSKAQENHAIVTVRNSKLEDFNLIFPTMLEGLYYGSSWLPIRKEVFWDQYHKVISSLLADASTRISVLCLSDDPDTIVGYLVHAHHEKVQILHWIYIKRAFRNFGFAKKLIKHAELDKEKKVYCSHMTTQGRKIMPKTWEFKPYFLF